MDIKCDQSCDMGYIYLQQFKQHQKKDFDKNRLIASAQPIEVIDNIYLKLNKLNWPDKKYIDALMDGDFIEEFQNDFDNEAYLKGIELELNQKRLESIIENYKLATFEFNEDQFYYIAFVKDEQVFNSKNYVYALSDKEDAFVIISRSQNRRYQITLGEDKDEEIEKALGPKIAYIRALMFNKEAPYDIDYLKKLKLYLSNDDY